ncbi:copper resistance protein CopC [Thermoflexus sp.]|uniref:copper resistance CopC family protein n=1 Tax=Thermoflexus sp. TaxID=1969742 RepID=UPI0017758B31|nr:copper resistance protein CopC [Thermoflexus sp.]
MRKALAGVYPLCLVLVLSLSGLVAYTAHAHAEIDRCEPSPGSSILSPPSEVRCWFTEELDPKGSTLSVLDAEGNAVDRGDAHVDLNDPDRKQLVVSLDPGRMKPGTYTVRWRTRSAEDGDIAEGTFVFTLQPAPAFMASPLPTPSPTPTAPVSQPASIPLFLTSTPTPFFPPTAHLRLPRWALPGAALIALVLLGIAALAIRRRG